MSFSLILKKFRFKIISVQRHTWGCVGWGVRLEHNRGLKPRGGVGEGGGNARITQTGHITFEKPGILAWRTLKWWPWAC